MAIRIYSLGLDVENGNLPFPPVAEETLGRFVLGGLDRHAEELAAIRRTHSVALTYRGEMERRSTVDLGDPRAAGWTYLINSNDPRAQEWQEALQPLAEHRGMDRGAKPLLFHGADEDAWHDWILDVLGPFQERRPHYILIVGGPDKVPFALQSLLDSAASVGRVDFASGEELRSYVDKLLRLERAPEPTVSRRCLVFATDHGWPDPTWLSRRYLAQPLGERIRERHGMEVEDLVDFDASADRLLLAAEGSPAFVMTVGHGQFVSAADEALRRRCNGAVVCQPGAGGLRLLTGEGVAATERFAEGAIFFQFACFGLGTPAVSGFSHWFEDVGNFVPARNAEQDFTAALPRALLSHPRGPVAFVGHLDVACLHGFDDAENPLEVELAGERWHARLAPFVDALDRLLTVQPVGLALETMNKRYDLANGVLANLHDRLRRGTAVESPELLAKLAHTFILRSDAQNYMVLGDPAARLRLPSHV